LKKNQQYKKSSYQIEKNSTSFSNDSVEPVWSFTGLSLKRSLYKKKNQDVFEDVRNRLLKFKEDWNLWLRKD
tara:strand:+ start:3854 stop:4069 length:216 start_codon:yes stop_codon:yes gene_type:complete